MYGGPKINFDEFKNLFEEYAAAEQEDQGFVLDFEMYNKEGEPDPDQLNETALIVRWYI